MSLEIQETRHQSTSQILKEHFVGERHLLKIMQQVYIKMAVNDPAERSFGALTGQLQCFGHIGLTNSAGVSQVRTNGDLSRGFETSISKKKNKSNTNGFFHTLTNDLRKSLIIMALEYSPETRKRYQGLLDNYRAAKREIEKLVHKHGIQKKTEKYIDTLYYYDKYNYHACWMNVKDVDEELEKLKRKLKKYGL